jgi:perosamine synthetase
MTPTGGSQSETPISLFTPEIRGNEWKYVKECLDTAWVSSVGSFVDRFERILAAQVGVKYAVATVNGTAAIHTALLSTGIQPGDEVLVSTLTFIASANAIRYAGAWPVFIDAEPAHWQMDPNLVEEFLVDHCLWKNGILRNKRTNRRVRAILPVHVLGHSVDMDPLLELAERFQLIVIEDAAEALGVKYKDRSAGGMGHVGCISFNGNKLITTGGGGVLRTNGEQIARRARYMTTQAKDDPTEYIHRQVGYNYRLTNLQAAVGCGQLECLPEFIAAKRAQAQQYAEQLAGIPGIKFYEPSPQVHCTFWMNTIRVTAAEFGKTSRELLEALRLRGIQTRGLWQPMHQSPAHAECESVVRGVADQLFAECLNLPSSVGLTAADIERVCDAIREQTGARQSSRAA